MKKFISFIVSSILIFNLVSVNVSAYSYSDYQTEVQKIIDEYGVFEQDEDLTYMFYGLIYAELIDFDNNGVEEMVCIYRHSLSNGGWERVADEGWASVVVYSVINGKLVSVFNAPLAASMLSSNPDYCIHYRMDNRKTYLIFDTVRENTVKNGINEKILIFTIDNEKPTCNILYGEALNFHEIGDVIYTKCMINDKMVSLEEYLAKQEWIHSEIRRISLLYHYYSEENEKHQHISYSKIVEFLNTLEQKSNAEIKVLLNGKKMILMYCQ